MEKSAVFCRTYGPTDESEFWRYPSHRVLGVFDDPDRVADAISSLRRSNFHDEAIEVLCGTEGEKQIDFTGEKHGWWGTFVRSLQNLSTERLFLEYYQKELHAGHYLLEVKVADSDEKRLAAKILNDTSAKRVTYFGNWFIEGIGTSQQRVEKNNYGYVRSLELSFSEAVERTREALKVEGFGVLTEIDLKAKFKEKLDVDFGNYLILGACNPSLAYQALQEEIELGLLLPCNVIVFQKEDEIYVAAVDAKKMLAVTGNTKLEVFADSVNEKLRRAIDSI
ncbi:MAG: DUF302 domain-containing protein [Acidobacteria bacterium]|nr:DUF302 domain-containing protein [Acidobacteriota bacterium]